MNFTCFAKTVAPRSPWFLLPTLASLSAACAASAPGLSPAVFPVSDGRLAIALGAEPSPGPATSLGGGSSSAARAEVHSGSHWPELSPSSDDGGYESWPLGGTTALLQESPPTDEPGSMAPGWEFEINVYGWLPDIPATIEVEHGDVTLPEDLGTIIDDLQYAAMLEFRARRGPIGVFFAPIFLGLEDTEHVQGPIQEHRIKIDEYVLLADFGASYEVGRWNLGQASGFPKVTVEPFAGARWLADDIDIHLDPGPKLTPKIDFITPIVGLRTFWELSDRWDLRIEGDYGGFHVDDVEKTYNLLGVVGYQFKMWGADSHVFAGYRYLHVLFDDTDEVTLKVTAKGPLVGIGWTF